MSTNQFLRTVIKNTGLVLICLFFSVTSQSQVAVPDTLQLDLPSLTDTVEAPPPEMDDVIDEESTDEPEVSSKYFLTRSMQLNGGGPDSLQLRAISDTVMNGYYKDDAFWYANENFYKKKIQPQQKKTPAPESPLFQAILWLVIIGVFIAVLVMYLSGSNVRLFRKNKAIASTEEHIETDDIFAINYTKEINKAASAGNYRLAVRLHFLRLLRQLSDNNLIQYKHDRTNFDYLLQMNKTNFYPEFSGLTRSYEYSWYGQFDIDQDKYAVIKNEFETLTRKISI